jgi:hypothetical protein
LLAPFAWNPCTGGTWQPSLAPSVALLPCPAARTNSPRKPPFPMTCGKWSRSSLLANRRFRFAARVHAVDDI